MMTETDLRRMYGDGLWTELDAEERDLLIGVFAGASSRVGSDRMTEVRRAEVWARIQSKLMRRRGNGRQGL